MLSKLKKSNEKGFTIIEVLIVLAIAGLILLIVFLAVPALQRSARNTSRKNDAAALLGAINEYTDNNAGALPTNGVWTSPDLTLCNARGCGGTDAQAKGKLGYYKSAANVNTGGTYTKGEVTINAAYTAPPNPAQDELIVEEASTCVSNTTAAGGSAQAVAVLYGIEASGTSSGYVWQCTGS